MFLFLERTGKVLALFGLLLAAGCSTTGAAGNSPIKIESIPPGADVYVMGEKVGETPFQISRDKVFPSLYPREKESLYGKVTLRKPGCTDFTRTISSNIGDYGLHAQLDCGDTYSSPSAAHVSAPPASETVEQRLNKIKELQGKGLINEEEAKKARERILNDL